MLYRSIGALQEKLYGGHVTCEQVLEAYLENIKIKKHLNAFVEVFEKTAREKAISVQNKINNKTAGKLAGVVVGIKDNICYKDHQVSASSKILTGFVSLYSATVIEKLLAEDAIIIGRLNCDEFAMGSSNETSFYGPVKNPFDETRVPGGSSGGSAAAVAADLCLVSLGSDTGGSIRQPASYCNLVGLKPSYGRISRHGLIAYASSLDQIGTFTHTVEDSALLLEVLAGKDEFDATVSKREVDNYTAQLQKKPQKLKIAYFSSWINHEGVDPEIKAKFFQIIHRLEADGHIVQAVDFPYLDVLIPIYHLISTAEASSNLGRYDGLRYGYRSQAATDLESVYKKSRSEGFGKEVKRRIILGTFVLSANSYDAYYIKSLKARRLVKNYLDQLLEKHDFLFLPTTARTAFLINDPNKDTIKMYLEDLYTVAANLGGQPAISLPMGQHSNGLPFGFQLMAPAFKEADLLSASTYFMELCSK